MFDNDQLTVGTNREVEEVGVLRGKDIDLTEVEKRMSGELDRIGYSPNKQIMVTFSIVYEFPHNPLSHPIVNTPLSKPTSNS